MSSAPPEFSIVIALYNDWETVERCLHSLRRQINAPPFEGIIVDDGSHCEAPESVRAWKEHFPLTILRQPHLGISAARNRGIQIARGSVLVFTDADCEMQSNALSVLANAVASLPRQNCFQLNVTSEPSNLLGRAEQLRLMSIRKQTLQPDGSIRYLNTAGFAVRRTFFGVDEGLFDPLAIRAEDSLLLAELIRRGELPFFVWDAVVQHKIKLSWHQCLIKDIRSGWHEGRTNDMIAAKGVSVRMSDSDRIEMMRAMWKSAPQESIGRMAWFVVVARRTVHKLVRSLYKLLRSSTDVSQAP